jgi:hypothetical protein
MKTLFLMLTTGSLYAQNITDGRALITAMHDRYASTWYKTVTFTQRTVTHLPDGQIKEETWFEAARLPSSLRISIAPVDSGNGMIFTRDSIFVFKRDRPVYVAPFIHPLMLLGFDAYTMPPDSTVSKLKQLGFDLSICRKDRWQDRDVYVVGAQAGDTVSKQFWVDAERLVFVRLLEPGPQDPNVTMETQFNKYIEVDGGWIETEVLFLVDGKMKGEEYYRDIHVNVPVDNNLFSIPHWPSTRFVNKP